MNHTTQPTPASEPVPFADTRAIFGADVTVRVNLRSEPIVVADRLFVQMLVTDPGAPADCVLQVPAEHALGWVDRLRQAVADALADDDRTHPEDASW